jgi:hypothetical protein
LLPPVGLGAAILVALGLFAGGWLGAALSNQIAGPWLRLGFGIFMAGLGVSLIVGTLWRSMA